MTQKTHKILGLMSGTSLDGLDLAYCHFTKENGAWQYKIIKTATVAYSSELQKALKNAIHLSALELIALHNSYGTWLGEQAVAFITENNIAVDYIASHGHTTHHQPALGVTLQIGSGHHLANASTYKTITDFRSNDVALGGQGAPLVPIGDLLLFKEYDFCLNLGGISNISLQVAKKRIAYDIGLANMILNYITRKIDLEYDANGDLARAGALNKTMLYRLNSLAYYKLPYPKSIGYEWFLNEVVPIVDATEDSIENLLHTAVHHICDQITIQIQEHKHQKNQQLLITGGGALNTFIMDTLKEKLQNTITCVIPEKELIDFKEAMVFAFMGVLKVENELNVLKSVTGAKRDSCSGIIYQPN